QHRVAVCYLDLDGFKPINDRLGHEAGDSVLIEIARRIELSLRGGDSVARLGGDEFVVLLRLAEEHECVASLERLLALISEPITIAGKVYVVGASIGVSIYPRDDGDADTLLRHADQAMYVAKQSGKNCFYVYDPEADQRIRSHNELLKSIQLALDHDQLELYFQPKVHLHSQRLVGVEALLRWRHPERGLLAPMEFLGAVENTELDIRIGNWVIAAAAKQFDAWRRNGLDIEISINISAYHLESPGFVAHLRQQLEGWRMPPSRLQIEILESAALTDLDAVEGIMQQCRQVGVSFALDDFGTGYSSLTYLSKLPVDVLKIDQSFVRYMLDNPADRTIVQGIIALARAFERRVVAEGVETERHSLTLLKMGCEWGQGYGIAKPMRAIELQNLYRFETSRTETIFACPASLKV
ncbi:MAG: EAL domain-containing protein, partial [Methylomonas sp.]|nr:EAL domain-containing protein [Methylomonas sp.]